MQPVPGVRKRDVLIHSRTIVYTLSISAYGTCPTVPFMMGNNVWKGGGNLNPNDEVGDVLNQGTLGIGFIGGHNAMMALYGQGHGHSKKAWNTLYKAIEVMNQVAEEYKQKYHLNYSVLATPAEGLSDLHPHRQTEIRHHPGVNDRDYYVNSFHVDVKEPISIVEKIKCEAPFHALTGRTYHLCGTGRRSPEECQGHSQNCQGDA